MFPNNGILLDGALKPKLLKIPLASCSFINIYSLLLYTAHFDNNIDHFLFLTLFILHFLYFFCTSKNMSTCFMFVFNI